nr:putative reverse transcriptase domain-containing protein [Tanacetum cinerariifolium]
MAHVTRQGLNIPPNNTNPNNMTSESVRAMIDQALLQNSTNRDGSHTYTERFQELTLICTKFVAHETKKIDKYIGKLPDNIYGCVKASKPKTLDETIELVKDLMDQKLRTKCHAAIACDEKLVRVPYGDKTMIFCGDESNDIIESRLTIISCSKAQEYIPKGCQIFLAPISAKKEEDKSEGKKLKYVPIVRDFHEVFPEDLSGLPPARL